MILGLRTCIVHVRPEQLGAAKAWYTRFAGAEPYFDQPFYVGFDVGGYELGLDPNPSAAHGRGGVVAYWRVDSLDDAVSHFTEAGATVVSPAQDVGESIKVATVADPFGNPIGLIENPHFSHRS